jgi:hypothetical protein
MRLVILLLLLPQAALAQGWTDRPGDVPLDAESLAALTGGAALTFYDDGQSKFSAGGAYSYTYADDGGTAYGTWRVETGGVICIDYRNGRSRCDRYVRNGGRLIVQTESGDRFPVRP